MPAPQKKLVRIKPSSKREVHVILGFHIKKADGWVEVPAAVAAACEREVVNDLNPDGSDLLFDVKDLDEAKAIAEREKRREDPAGTPDKPRVPQRTAAPEPTGKRGKRGAEE